MATPTATIRTPIGRVRARQESQSLFFCHLLRLAPAAGRSPQHTFRSFARMFMHTFFIRALVVSTVTLLYHPVNGEPHRLLAGATCRSRGPPKLCVLTSSSGKSIRPHPLGRIEHPSTLRLEILPRVARRRTNFIDPHIFPPDAPILHPTDYIRLTLSAFSRTFYLHLDPNHDILHPEARINYFRTASDGTSVLDHSEDLIRDAVMMYQGDVVRVDKTLQRLREDAAGGLDPNHHMSEGPEGWARIVLHSMSSVSPLVPVSALTDHLRSRRQFKEYTACLRRSIQC